MKIKVKIFENLRDVLPEDALGDSDMIEAPEGATVGEVLEILKIPSDIRILTLVNSARARNDRVIEPGDRLEIFPPIAGG